MLNKNQNNQNLLFKNCKLKTNNKKNKLENAKTKCQFTNKIESNMILKCNLCRHKYKDFKNS